MANNFINLQPSGPGTSRTSTPLWWGTALEMWDWSPGYLNT